MTIYSNINFEKWIGWLVLPGPFQGMGVLCKSRKELQQCVREPGKDLNHFHTTQVWELHHRTGGHHYWVHIISSRVETKISGGHTAKWRSYFKSKSSQSWACFWRQINPAVSEILAKFLPQKYDFKAKFMLQKRRSFCQVMLCKKATANKRNRLDIVWFRCCFQNRMGVRAAGAKPPPPESFLNFLWKWRMFMRQFWKFKEEAWPRRSPPATPLIISSLLLLAG